MIDIHTHLLTGIDNGCKDFSDAGKVILEAKSQGVTAMFITPHETINDKISAFELKERFAKFNQIFSKYGVDLYLGAEIDYSSDALVKIFYKTLLSMNETNFALLDFSHAKEKYDMVEVINKYKQHNIKVIVAHIERYNLSLREIEKIKNAGAYIQVDAYSVFDKRYEKKVKEMLDERLIDFISSNAHSSTETYAMKAAFNDIAKKTTKDYAEQIFTRNAMNLLIKKGNIYR